MASTYVVIGIHEDGTENRFAETYVTDDPTTAECLALCEHPALLIAGVVEGDCKLVDDDPNGSGEDPARDRAEAQASAEWQTDGAGI